MLRLLADENLPASIVEGVCRRLSGVDFIRVQDVGLVRTPDADILEWAAQQARVVVSLDKKTLTTDAWNRVANGQPMPGVIILRQHLITTGQAINELELHADAGMPDDMKDRVLYLPLS
jgi:predicted nuclease of predicted toxin-antitoxin system